jgi:hypothetical protein
VSVRIEEPAREKASAQETWRCPKMISLTPIVAAVVPARIDSEYAVDPANDTASRPANDTNNAADRPEHAVAGIGPAVSPVVYSSSAAVIVRLLLADRGAKLPLKAPHDYVLREGFNCAAAGSARALT